MNYEEAVSYISEVLWTERTRGLERIKDLLHKLGNPQNRLKCIHIAGTNGKGSTAAMLESVFRACGYKTGLFTSPHLSKYNERIRVNGQDISDEDFTRIAGLIKQKSEKMFERPTVFENLTAMGFEYFAEQSCDIVILEVGMGGEFDSTNVIEKPLISVITAIGFDHMAQLGDTLPQIASAKAGIIKSMCPVVYLEQAEEVTDVFIQRAHMLGASEYMAEQKSCSVLTSDVHGQELLSKYFDKPLFIPLIGEYQQKNLSLVLKVLEVYQSLYEELPSEGILTGLNNVSWPARFELLNESPVFILDGAHNAHGIRAMTDSLKKLFPGKKVKYILGVLADKNFPEMVDILCENAGEFHTVMPESSRALSVEELDKIISKHDIKVHPYKKVDTAIEECLKSSLESDVICSLGSLYLAGEVREYMLNRNACK